MQKPWFRDVSRFQSSDGPGLPRWIGASCGVHVLIVLLLANGIHLPPSQHHDRTVCEFILQTNNEKNTQPTNKIAEHDSNAHGRRDKQRPINHIASAARPSNPRPRSATRTAPKRQIAMKHVIPRLLAMKPKPTPPPKRRPAPHPVQTAKLPVLPAPPRQQVREIEQAPPAVAVQPRPQPAVEETVLSQAAVIPREEEESHANGGTGINDAPPAPPARSAGAGFNPSRDTDDGAPSEAAKKDVDFGPYMAYLHRVLAKVWRPPGGHSARCVKVMFQLSRNGTISGLRVARSCGNPTYDQAAVEAVRSAAPFRSLPKGSPQSVDIDYTFDYHVLGH